MYEPNIAGLAFPFPELLARGGLNALVLAPLKSESRVFGLIVAARREAESFSSVECEFLRQLSEHVALAARREGISRTGSGPAQSGIFLAILGLITS